MPVADTAAGMTVDVVAECCFDLFECYSTKELGKCKNPTMELDVSCMLQRYSKSKLSEPFSVFAVLEWFFVW